jgi:MOSC domain-containing protein YiiM
MPASHTSSTLRFMFGTLERIWIKRMKRGPMEAVPAADLLAGKGIAGNANRAGRRQVTLLDVDRWADAMAELEADLDPAARRANFLLRGIDLEGSRDRVIRIGEVQIRIEGETKPCERMDEALPGLQAALRPGWRGGAYGVVLVGGAVRSGDRAAWIPEERR